MRLEKMRKIAGARTKGSSEKIQFIAMAANNFDKLLDVVEAAKEASKEIDNFYTKMTQSSHVQTIAEDDHDLWFHRDRIIMALEALEKE